MHRIASVVIALVALSLSTAASAATLSADLQKGLQESKFVYIQSTRKGGALSKAAEIWFLYANDAVYVGTRPDSWRAKRIKWGRPQAKIAVGKQDGPSFKASGAIVKEPETEKLMLETYAKKYPDAWSKYDKSFRDGFKAGSRVLIKYTPVWDRNR